MNRSSGRLGALAVFLVAALLAAGCTGEVTPTETSPGVTTTDAAVTTTAPDVIRPRLISGSTTQLISVYRPTGPGPWPVVYAVPGSGGSAHRDLGVLASELARNGVLVFATDWRTDLIDDADLESDAECGYRYVRTVAEDHGGDLDSGVTMIGFSLGAPYALHLGLSTANFDSGTADGLPCPPGAPRPEAVVAIQGCYDMPFTVEDRIDDWDNFGATVVLMSGSEDTVCLPSKTTGAASLLTDAGLSPDVEEVEGANHGALVFHDPDNDWAELPADHPIGQTTVETILSVVESVR